jgi:hypothetical protein
MNIRNFTSIFGKHFYLTGLLFLLSLGGLNSCKTSGLAVKAPDCVDDLIRTSLQNPPANPRTEVWLWELDGVKWYYFNAPCCDQFSTLYNADCEKVCAPDGGFTGKGDGQCPPGLDKAKKTLVWSDQR